MKASSTPPRIFARCARVGRRNTTSDWVSEERRLTLSHTSSTHAGRYVPGGNVSCAPAAEERQQQEEDVEDVEEDRGGKQRSCLDLVGATEALEVVHRVAGEDHETEHRIDHIAAGNRDEQQHDPEHDQPEQRKEGDARDLREVASRRVAVGTEAADEERGRTACLPERLRVDRGVVGEHRRRGEPEEGTEAEEQADRKLLGALDRDVEPEDAGERADERDDAPATRESRPR